MSLQNLIPLCIAAGISVFLLIVAIFSAPPKKKILSNTVDEYEKKEEWLYSNFLEKLYDTFFGKKDPVEVAKAFGLEYDKYMINCQIINKNPNMKKEAMLRIFGVFGFVIGALASILMGLNLIPFVIGVIIYLLCVSRVTKNVSKAAENKKVKIMTELPRFVDLLQSALDIGLPVDIAISETAKTVPCIISEELNLSIVQMELGAESWQKALENMAHKYEINVFSDFVLDIITAYNKGISVKDAVARKSYEIRQSALLRAKEKTAKLSTSILVPIMIYKIVPLLAIMLVPIVKQIAVSFL